MKMCKMHRVSHQTEHKAVTFLSPMIHPANREKDNNVWLGKIRQAQNEPHFLFQIDILF